MGYTEGMFGFGKRQKKRTPLILVHIDGASISAAVAIIEGQTIKVCVIERAPAPPEERGAAQLTSVMTTKLGEVAHRIVEKYAKHPASKEVGPADAIHVTVGAPHVTVRTARKKEDYAEPKVITDALIQQLARTAFDGPQDTVLETTVARVSVNGYPSSDPLHKKAQQLEVTSFQSSIAPALKAALTQQLGSVAPGRPLVVRSHMRVLSQVVDTTVIDHEEYLLTHVGDEATSCVVMRHEEILAQSAIPIGDASIIRKIAAGGSPETIVSLVRMLGNDTCSGPACDEIKSKLAQIEPELVKQFGDMFAQLSKNRRLPALWILSEDGELSGWLQHFLSRIDFSQFTVTGNPPRVVLLAKEQLFSGIQWETTEKIGSIAVLATFLGSDAK